MIITAAQLHYAIGKLPRFTAYQHTDRIRIPGEINVEYKGEITRLRREFEFMSDHKKQDWILIKIIWDGNEIVITA